MQKSSQQMIRWFLLFILLFTILLFFVGGPDYYSSRSFKSLWDQGHIIFYTVFIFYLLRFFPWFGELSFLKQSAWGFLITLSTGIILELVQIQFARIPEIGDIWRNCLGCAVALVYFSKSFKQISTLYLNILKALIVFLILVELSNPAKAVIDENIAKKQFPYLSGFETPFEIDRWEPGERIKRNRTYVTEGKYSAEIHLTTDKYSGITLNYFPHNWQKFNHLYFSVYNPTNQVLRLTCRIHDWQHIERGQRFSDRFNKRLFLQPGWNKIKISLLEIKSGPVNRLMNLEKIYNFGFFASNLKQPLKIYLDEVKLD